MSLQQRTSFNLPHAKHRPDPGLVATSADWCGFEDPFMENSHLLFLISNNPIPLSQAKYGQAGYQRLLSPYLQEATCISRWQRSYPSLTSQALNNLWTLLLVCKLWDSRDRNHSWKFLHRALPTNSWLHHCNLTQNDQYINGCPLWTDRLRKDFTLLILQSPCNLLKTSNYPIRLLCNFPTTMPMYSLMYLVTIIPTFWQYWRFRLPPAIIHMFGTHVANNKKTLENLRYSQQLNSWQKTQKPKVNERSRCSQNYLTWHL